MKGKVVSLREMIDDNEITRGYVITIETKEKPDLKLGECDLNINIK